MNKLKEWDKYGFVEHKSDLRKTTKCGQNSILDIRKFGHT